MPMCKEIYEDDVGAATKDKSGKARRHS